MFEVNSYGDHKNTTDFLNRLRNGDPYSDLNGYGQEGVAALANATPMNSGLTANSWAYRVIKSRKRPGIEWYNTNPAGTASVAVLIQYGHATGTGGYVIGIDYINPAMRPLFDRIAEDVWRKVKQ